MNFSQLHERLRLELLRRIEREVLTASLLASKTGLQQPHISNFLRNKRRLSIPALDRVLAALELSVADLVPSRSLAIHPMPTGIPLVSQAVAIHDDRISPASIIEDIPLPKSIDNKLRTDHGARRPTRERFVAITLSSAQARPMDPVLRANSILVLDRHSTIPDSPRSPTRSIYAVHLHGELHFFYLAYERNFLILRPHFIDYPVQLLAVPLRISPADLITGRICTIIALP